jgi:cytochrome c biogenesis protein CcdA
MTLTLLAGLLGIALVDSLNPSALVVTTLLLSGANPYRRSLAYIAGIALTYYAVGVAVLLGAGDVLTSAVDGLRRPAVGFGVELALGVVLVVVGLRRRSPPRDRTGPRVRGTSAPAAFLTGMTVTAVESTTALPYIGALTALARSDVSSGATLLVLALYNIVFVLPPLALVLVQALRPGEVQAVVERVRNRIRSLDTRLTRALLLVLGLLMVLDALVYFVRGEAAF